MKKQLEIGDADAAATAKDFISAWKKAERGARIESRYKLHFESLEMLLKTLTAGRWVLLRLLRLSGPLSVRALAAKLGRDYKNVHSDVQVLEAAGLIERTADNKVQVPWDIVEAKLQLAA